METFNRKWKQEQEEEANSDSLISFKRNTEICFAQKGRGKVKEKSLHVFIIVSLR